MGPIQSPPSTSNYLVLGTTAAVQHRPGDAINIQPPTSLSPNSTPGLQMPAPAATPPIVNINGMSRVMGHGMEKMGLEGQISEADPSAMIWKGMQGGILAEMFPTSSACQDVMWCKFELGRIWFGFGQLGLGWAVFE